MINAKQSESFLALYKHRNITKAAEELFMTRQALSAGIKSLEEELGVPLFLRSNKGLTSTSAGDTLYQYILRDKQLWEACLSEIHTERKAEPLRIGLHLMYYSAELLRKIKYFSRQACGFNPVLINMTDSGESRELLEEGRADLVITHKPLENSSLCWENLLDDRAFAIMREDDPLAQKETIDFVEDFSRRSLIFPSAETMHDVETILESEHANCSVISSDRVLIKESILSDRAVMIIPEKSIGNFLSEGMTTRLVTNFPVTNGVYLIFREERITIRRFIEELRMDLQG